MSAETLDACPECGTVGRRFHPSPMGCDRCRGNPEIADGIIARRLEWERIRERLGIPRRIR